MTEGTVNVCQLGQTRPRVGSDVSSRREQQSMKVVQRFIRVLNTNHELDQPCGM
jgi:hypothetical protein